MISATEKPHDRRPYETPRLRHIGSVADLTRGTGTGPGGGFRDIRGSGTIYGDIRQNTLRRMLDQRDSDGNRF